MIIDVLPPTEDFERGGDERNPSRCASRGATVPREGPVAAK